MQELRVGAIVRLNSGGPNAMVVACNGREVTIEWKDGLGNLETLTLPTLCVTQTLPDQCT
jgi:uncharacterized protein YodC (DUF2158 family)